MMHGLSISGRRDIWRGMALGFSTLSELLNHGFDTVIDVRSPAEYAEDHIHGAINLPVLDNEERARVGTIYKQQSPFLARKVGAALVFRNAAAHVQGPLAHHEGGWRPLVYCWRGGQRSGSFCWMLREIGWRSDTIAGGYQTFRRMVYALLYDDTPLPWRLVLLDGNTGTAKTELLRHLRDTGTQVIDLEGLARHRGSLLGSMGEQPSQKAFETGLAQALLACDPARPVVVEAESNKIGARVIPPRLWLAMRDAPRIEIAAPLEARTADLTKAYDDILSDPERLKHRLQPLRAVRGGAVLDGWSSLIDAGDKAGITRALMTDHYDPSYAKSRTNRGGPVLARLDTPGMDAPHLATLAGRVAAALDQWRSDSTPG